MKPQSTNSHTATPTMESLALPRELYWDVKMEPTSPPCSELFSLYDIPGDWLDEDNFANDIKTLNEDFKADPGLIDLINGDDIVIELCDFKIVKDENWSVSNCIDVDTGILAAGTILTKVHSPSTPYAAIALDAASFDNAVLTQLTPPHSPPLQPSGLTSPALHTVAISSDNHFEHTPSSSLAPSPTPLSTALQHDSFPAWGSSNSHTVVAEFSDDIARDVQIVDDIVNTRAKELLNWNDECTSLSSSYSAASQADDEWYPDGSSSSDSASLTSSASSSPSHCDSGNATPMDCDSGDISPPMSTQSTKKRPRPYGRAIEDRKIRKKEQNKNAATRYRQKKKLEMESVLSVEQKLVERNEELQRLLADAKREEKYLKSLIREFYTRKMKK